MSYHTIPYLTGGEVGIVLPAQVQLLHLLLKLNVPGEKEDEDTKEEEERRKRKTNEKSWSTRNRGGRDL